MTILLGCDMCTPLISVVLNLYIAYYLMSPERRPIVDSLSSTDGTKINWRMMETMINTVENLDYLVLFHRAGEYEEGELVFGVLHTLNWTNSVNFNKHVVIIKNTSSLMHKVLCEAIYILYTNSIFLYFNMFIFR